MVNHPKLYEINTRCWLRELSDACGRKVTLANIPDREFGHWQRLGFSHIWLMGVWTTGPKSRTPALTDPDLKRSYDQFLPGWRDEDVAGSPYAVADYKVPPPLGDETALKIFRKELHARGMKLVLDFVPNHLGLDHHWLDDRPELFVQSPVEVPGTFSHEAATGIHWLAHGKDPYFAPWTDTAQLDYRRSGTRVAMKELLLSVAARCDGVRCDMAMLLLNDVFVKTWASFPSASAVPDQEFWADTISAVKQAHPEFIFLAEVYWDLEERMQSLGFDYTYDKRLYDDLFWRNAAGVQRRLFQVSRNFMAASAHFLENHDEPRIASQLSLAEHRAAALVIMGLPGMRFLHEGQLTGARLKTPVQLARRPPEPTNPEVAKIYDQLLPVLQCTAIGSGQAEVLSPQPAWPGNPTAQNFVIVQWQMETTEFDLVIVNLAPHRSQCHAPLTVPALSDHNWSMQGFLGPERYERYGADLASHGLFLDLPGHGAQLFHFEPLP